MAKRSLSNISKWTSRQIASFKDLKSLNLKQTEELAKRAYDLTIQRIKRIEKAKALSPAYENRFGGTRPEAPTENMRRQSLQVKFVQYQSFLQAKTSTVQGIEKMNRQTYARLFPGGVNPETGEEVTFSEFMSQWNIDQQRRYWAAYTEFMHQNARFYDQSTRVQQVISRMTFWRNKRFSQSDLDEILKEMESYNEQGYNPNVRTGRRAAK